ncbi:MAG TPA: hypothetical protein VLE02_00945 [Nitrosarchaeum sp.]|nr:hypothetical protein [Nitrosarchaeum sp.]
MVCSLINNTVGDVHGIAYNPSSKEIVDEFKLKFRESYQFTADQLSVVILKVYNADGSVHFDKLFPINLNGTFFLEDKKLRYDGEKIIENFSFVKENQFKNHLLIIAICIVALIIAIIFLWKLRDNP